VPGPGDRHAQCEHTFVDLDGDFLEDRLCGICRRTYSRAEQRALPGWEPSPKGWRCPTCARERHAELREQAHALIAQTDEPWTLVLAEHDDQELAATMRRILLEAGGLTRADALALRRALLGA
jgi:hypothetical protein